MGTGSLGWSLDGLNSKCLLKIKLLIADLKSLILRYADIVIVLSMSKSHITFSLGLLVSSLLCGQTILYVNKDAPNTDGDGLSWSTAFKHLNDAFDLVNEPDFFNNPSLYDHQIRAIICVAEGTYYPDEGTNKINDDQSSKFNPSNRIASIIGGFRGDEVSLDQADPEIYVTILSGHIYEEYGITGLGANQLIYLHPETTLQGFTLVNNSNSYGTIASSYVSEIGSYTTPYSSTEGAKLINCRITDSSSSGYLLYHLELVNCLITDCSSTAAMVVNVSCSNNTIFQGNDASILITQPRGIVDCLFLENTASNNLIHDYTSNSWGKVIHISNSVFYRNIAGERIIRSDNSNLKIRGITYVDNFNESIGSEIYATDIFLEKSLFFRSSLNRSPIFDSVTLGYNASSSGSHLPIESKFFGINNYNSLSSLSGSASYSSIYGTTYTENIFNGSVITESFLTSTTSNYFGPSVSLSLPNMGYEELLSLFAEGDNINDVSLGNSSFTPELCAILFPTLLLPDPFIDSDNPLGVDGIPFTSDDGLNLDPASAWADEVINTPTINYDYGSTDILGNDRIIGGKIDLGAYEYTPVSDADGDGVSDADDAFDDDPAEYADTDGDLIGDNADDDDDGDGIPDATEIAAGLDPKQYDGSLYDFVQSLGQGIFTEMELQQARQAAINGVLSDPTSYDLYTPSSIMDLNFGGVMIQASESGNLDFSYTIESSDDLTTWETHSQPTIEITPPASKQFMRIRIGKP